MKRILLSVLTISLVGAVTIGATGAYFSDTETSAGNQFTAGVIDLEIDSAGNKVFSAQDDPLPKIFEYLPANDIKPGDKGEVTLSLHLKTGSNNANLWMQVLNLVNNKGLEPESEIAGDDIISDDVTVKVWIDDGDNVWETSETILHEGTIASLAALVNPLVVQVNAVASTTYYVGFSWELPAGTGDEHQGDYCTFDIKFGAKQIGMP